MTEAWEWTTAIIGWTIMFVTLSITKYKIIKVGGGLKSIQTEEMRKESMIANIIIILYFITAGVITHLYRFPDFIQYEFLAHYFHYFLGVFVFAAAIWLYMASRIALGSNWSWKGQLLRDKTKLITCGPYCKIRHPTYTAFVLAGFASGITIAVTNVLFFMLLVLPMIYWRAKVDEKHLKAIFPEYKEYMKKTRMFF